MSDWRFAAMSGTLMWESPVGSGSGLTLYSELSPTLLVGLRQKGDILPANYVKMSTVDSVRQVDERTIELKRHGGGVSVFIAPTPAEGKSWFDMVSLALSDAQSPKANAPSSHHGSPVASAASQLSPRGVNPAPPSQNTPRTRERQPSDVLAASVPGEKSNPFIIPTRSGRLSSSKPSSPRGTSGNATPRGYVPAAAESEVQSQASNSPRPRFDARDDDRTASNAEMFDTHDHPTTKGDFEEVSGDLRSGRRGDGSDRVPQSNRQPPWRRPILGKYDSTSRSSSLGFNKSAGVPSEQVGEAASQASSRGASPDPRGNDPVPKSSAAAPKGAGSEMQSVQHASNGISPHSSSAAPEDSGNLARPARAAPTAPQRAKEETPVAPTALREKSVTDADELSPVPENHRASADNFTDDDNDENDDYRQVPSARSGGRVQPAASSRPERRQEAQEAPSRPESVASFASQKDSQRGGAREDGKQGGDIRILRSAITSQQESEEGSINNEPDYEDEETYAVSRTSSVPARQTQTQAQSRSGDSSSQDARDVPTKGDPRIVMEEQTPLVARNATHSRTSTSATDVRSTGSRTPQLEMVVTVEEDNEPPVMLETQRASHTERPFRRPAPASDALHGADSSEASGKPTPRHRPDPSDRDSVADAKSNRSLGRRGKDWRDTGSLVEHPITESPIAPNMSADHDDDDDDGNATFDRTTPLHHSWMSRHRNDDHNAQPAARSHHPNADSDSRPTRRDRHADTYAKEQGGTPVVSGYRVERDSEERYAPLRSARQARPGESSWRRNRLDPQDDRSVSRRTGGGGANGTSNPFRGESPNVSVGSVSTMAHLRYGSRGESAKNYVSNMDADDRDWDHSHASRPPLHSSHSRRMSVPAAVSSHLGNVSSEEVYCPIEATVSAVRRQGSRSPSRLETSALRTIDVEPYSEPRSRSWGGSGKPQRSLLLSQPKSSRLEKPDRTDTWNGRSSSSRGVETDRKFGKSYENSSQFQYGDRNKNRRTPSNSGWRSHSQGSGDRSNFRERGEGRNGGFSYSPATQDRGGQLDRNSNKPNTGAGGSGFRSHSARGSERRPLSGSTGFGRNGGQRDGSPSKYRFGEDNSPTPGRYAAEDSSHMTAYGAPGARFGRRSTSMPSDELAELRRKWEAVRLVLMEPRRFTKHTVRTGKVSAQEVFMTGDNAYVVCVSEKAAARYGKGRGSRTYASMREVLDLFGDHCKAIALNSLQRVSLGTEEQFVMEMGRQLAPHKTMCLISSTHAFLMEAMSQEDAEYYVSAWQFFLYNSKPRES